MDDIKALITLLWGISLTRYIVLLIAAYGIFMVILCLLLEQKQPEGLYRAPAHIRTKKMSLQALMQSYEANPKSWLLFEEEIFYVKDPENLTDEQRELYYDASGRYESGGLPARKVGKRVLIDRRDARAYHRFFKRTLKKA